MVEGEPGAVCTLAILVVADLVDGEEEVDKVAGRAEAFVVGVGVGVGTEELAATLKEEGTLLVGQHTVAVNPFR